MKISSVEIQGILLFISNGSAEKKRVADGISQTDKTLLDIIASILAGALFANAGHISTENAKKLIGQIGHEIESPVSELAGVAHSAMRDLRELVWDSRVDTKEVKRRVNLLVEARRNEMHLIQEHISVLMDVAVAMAQESDNKINVTFEAFDLFSLLDETAARVATEVALYQSQGTKCEFIFNDAMKSVRSFVGDRYLIQKIFVNLFRNALKYSIPPGAGRPIRIRVVANPQVDVLIILITNWGSPIRRRDFERIFTPFERGDGLDRIRARRGMGLGLYIARRFALAHQGSVTCKSSKSTFDDPRRKDIEGFETVFEVRLSRHLRQGPTEVRI